MKNIIMSQHPIFNNQSEIIDICQPLEKFGITYFSHVHIDNAQNFSAISKGPDLAEHYLKNKYYNADIHMASDLNLGDHVVWDAIELNDQSAELFELAKSLKYYHTFTIIEKNQNGSDFYHFGSHIESNTMNQVYLSNYNLLKLFIPHFNNQVEQSSVLASWKNFKLGLEMGNGNGFSIRDAENLLNIDNLRDEFYNLVPQDLIGNKSNFNLSPQQIRCLHLLSEGHSDKQIAKVLNLSFRTVNHYLENIRRKLGCRNSKELIKFYLQLIKSREMR